jgi:hypothetical protein
MESKSDKLISQLRKLYGNSVVESTLGTYKGHLERARELMGIKSDKIKDIISSPKELGEALKIAKYKHSVIHNMLRAFAGMAVRLGLDEDIQDLYEKINLKGQEEMDEYRLNNKISEKNVDKWAKWEDIEKVYDEIKVKDLSSCLDKLIVGLYTRLSGYIARLDYAYVMFIPPSEIKKSDEERDNYIYFNEKENKYFIVLNDYKTSKKYGKIVIPVLDKSLNKLLDTWFDDYNKEQTWLLVSSRDPKEPLSEKALSKRIIDIFKRYLGKKINNQVLRQIYESHTIYDKKDEYDKLTIGEKIILHKKLMHSFNTAHEYAKKGDGKNRHVGWSRDNESGEMLKRCKVDDHSNVCNCSDREDD